MGAQTRSCVALLGLFIFVFGVMGASLAQCFVVASLREAIKRIERPRRLIAARPNGRSQ